MSTTVTVPCQRATYTRDGANASTRFYTTAKTELRVENSHAHTFVYFPPPLDLPGQVVESAVVQLTPQNPSITSVNVLRRHMDPTPLSYPRLTWTNEPAVVTGSVGITGTRDSDGNFLFDVLADYQASASGDPIFGFRMTTDDTTRRVFYGPQAAVGAPVLLVTYSEVTAAPQGIQPSGGYTSTSKPIVTWPVPDDISQVQVQIDVVGGTFASPTFTSAATNSTVGVFDLAASAYAGCANGAQVDMRVQHLGPNGWSGWSLPVRWGYAARPVVVLTSPGAASGDPTPPHTWTVTPSGEMAWQVAVQDKVTKVGLWDSKRSGGSDLSVTPANGPSADNQVATTTLRVWDRPDRIATPGQPVYTEVVHDWTLDFDLTSLPASSLSVTQVGAKPLVRVAFERTTGTPDEWLVYVGDRMVKRFDYNEHTTSTGWSYDTWEVAPNRDVVVSVVPMVGTQAGKPKTFAVHTRVDGVWLVDPTTSEHFSLADGGPDASYGESSQVYTPIGGDRVVVRTMGYRGLEGSVALVMDDYDDGVDYRTALNQAESAWRIKEVAHSRELRFIYGATNIPVAIRALSVPDDTSDNSTVDAVVKRCSFEFYQTGELPFTNPFSVSI